MRWGRCGFVRLELGRLGVMEIMMMWMMSSVFLSSNIGCSYDTKNRMAGKDVFTVGSLE